MPWSHEPGYPYVELRCPTNDPEDDRLFLMGPAPEYAAFSSDLLSMPEPRRFHDVDEGGVTLRFTNGTYRYDFIEYHAGAWLGRRRD